VQNNDRRCTGNGAELVGSDIRGLLRHCLWNRLRHAGAELGFVLRELRVDILFELVPLDNVLAIALQEVVD
jgi:hypothetical protein